MTKLKIKTGDVVKVIAGAHKSTPNNDVTGKVIKVLREENKAIVEGVNVVKKHAKPSAQNPQGGIVEKEAPIHISNLALMTSKGEATRVGYRVEGDKKVRFSKKSNEVI
ncbi:50S ribosomal protein L24 [Aquimarina sp. AU474]|uniref:50S ribosomal protein L24 n=1 Tax=Aquimarina sp. AU474 TaxID=2108529 RepID=UPI000D687012|nr:50S ribosomal protein L24 [Aquimarina sp. AU474]